MIAASILSESSSCRERRERRRKWQIDRSNLRRQTMRQLDADLLWPTVIDEERPGQPSGLDTRQWRIFTELHHNRRKSLRLRRVVFGNEVRGDVSVCRVKSQFSITAINRS